jgi:hypothetical protein
MQICDHRPISPETMTDSPICRVEYCNDNQLRVVLYSGYIIHITRAEIKQMLPVFHLEVVDVK